MSTWQT